MKKVLTVGVFDYFHWPSAALSERQEAWRLPGGRGAGQRLHPEVQPDAKVLYTTGQRIDLIRALKVVDEVVTYKSIDEDIKGYDFDIFAIGEDQTHAGFQRRGEF